MKNFLALNISVFVFIMVMNVKLPAIVDCWHLNISEPHKFCAQLSWVWKQFDNLEARFKGYWRATEFFGCLSITF